MLIGACANLKPSCEICAYWNSGVILKVGPVIVRMSRDDSTLDVIGRCKVTNGSKQALNMTWFVLAKFFYGIETLLMNFKGICPMVREGDYEIETSFLSNCCRRVFRVGEFRRLSRSLKI